MNSKVKNPASAKATAGRQKSRFNETPETPGGSAMEQLLARYEPQTLRRWEKIEGKVTGIATNKVLLDFGGKSEGVVEGREYDLARLFIKGLKIGDKVVGTVVIPEMESGLTLISLRNVAEDALWQELERARENDVNVRVVARGVTRGGLTVEYKGLFGFIPTSHLGMQVSSKIDSIIGKVIQVKVEDLDRGRERVVFSERSVSESGEIARQKTVISGLKKGEKFSGEVVNIAPFGAFVRIEKDDMGFDGLLPAREIRYGDLKIGDKVEVKVVGVLRGKISLGFAAKEKTDASLRFPRDTRVEGTAIKITDKNVVVEIERGITGVIPLSAITPGTKISEGEKVSCFVSSVDKTGRITLGLVLKAKPIGYK